MRIFQIPMLKNFEINPYTLEMPLTLPFNMPEDKKEKILNLLIWGLNSYQPDFLALDYEDVKNLIKTKNTDQINGVKVDKKTVLCVSVRKEAELRDIIKSRSKIPSLMIVINILNPKVQTSRRWLFQLKNEVVDAIRKTIYEDKKIDENLLNDAIFDEGLKNFEDPLDVIEFLDLAISIRLKNKSIEDAIDEAFIKLISDKIAALELFQFKTLLSLIITNDIQNIQKLTSLSEKEIGEAINGLNLKGLIHHGKKPVLPLYLKKLENPHLLNSVIEQVEIKRDKEEFDEIKELYFRIAD